MVTMEKIQLDYVLSVININMELNVWIAVLLVLTPKIRYVLTVTRVALLA